MIPSREERSCDKPRDKHPAVEIVQSVVGAGTFLAVVYMLLKATGYL